MKLAFRFAAAAGAVAIVMAGPSSASTPVWTPTHVSGDWGRAALSALSDGTVMFSLASPTVDELVRSTDGGRTWAAMPAVPEPNVGITRFSTPLTGWSLGLSEVYATRDGGDTWRASSALPSDGGAGRPFAIGAAEGTSTVVVGGTAQRKNVLGCNYATSGVLWTSHDGGRRWIRANLGAEHLPIDVRMYDRRRAIATSYEVSFADRDSNCFPQLLGTSVWLTDNGGRTWRRVHKCRTYCTAAVIVAPNRLLIGRNDGTTSHSDDGGRTWIEGQPLTAGSKVPGGTDLGQTFWVDAFAFSDARNGYAATKAGGTWRTADGGRTWTNEISPDHGYAGFGTADAAVINAENAVVGGVGVVSTRINAG